MKKYTLLFTLIFTAFSFGQQEPYFASSGFTSFWNNPASLGSWNKFSASTLGRLDWVGLNNTPKSFMLNIESDTYFTARSNSERGVNLPLGLTFITESIGGVKSQSLSFPFSVPFKLGNTTLALGLAPGFKRIDFTDAIWQPTQTIDDSLLHLSSATKFQLKTALFWYSSKFYLGFSTTQTLPTEYADGYYSRVHYWMQGAYRFKLKEHSILTMLSASYSDGFVAYRIMNYFQFKEDIFSVGIGLSLFNSLSLGATYRLKKIKLAYNFDWPKSSFSPNSKGSHEVRLSYVIPKTQNKVMK